MNSFALTIVANSKVCFRGQARICTVFSTTGARSFEAHHESFMAVLVPDSVVSFREEGGKENQLPVADGLISFVENSCMILVSLAEVPVLPSDN